MPITSKTFVRSTALLMLIGLLALVGIVATNVWLVDRSQDYFEDVLEARTIRRASVDLLSTLQDMETGQRGYLLTQDRNYLEPYENHLGNLDQQFEQLQSLLEPYPDNAPELETLQANITYKRKELSDTIDLAENQGFAAAVQRIRTDSGKQAMDDIRGFLTSIMDRADDRISQDADSQRQVSTLLRWITLLGGLIILGVVGGAIWSVMSYTAALANARRLVEEANQSLEERVAERTVDLGKANEEIQRFAYIVTHDLRAPLVNVMGFTSEMEAGVASVRSYMEAQPPSPDPLAQEARLAALEDLPEAVTFIRAATRKMDGLINAILKISREGRRTLKPESLDLATLVQNSVNAVHHQILDSQGEVDSDIRVTQLVSDRLSLEQVFGNLLDNAIKYQHPDRPLNLRIHARHAPNNRIIVEVADNGRGIAASDHERVFELFRRSGAQTNPGEGIGLAHVRTMVRSLGGDITLTSKLGEGTTFFINLPRDLRSYLGAPAA